jgi:hypothetical protein
VQEACALGDCKLSEMAKGKRYCPWFSGEL